MEQILFYEISFREPLIGKDVPGNFFTRLLQHAGKKGRVEFNPHASHPLTARTQKNVQISPHQQKNMDNPSRPLHNVKRFASSLMCSYCVGQIFGGEGEVV